MTPKKNLLSRLLGSKAESDCCQVAIVSDDQADEASRPATPTQAPATVEAPPHDDDVR